MRKLDFDGAPSMSALFLHLASNCAIIRLCSVRGFTILSI